MPAVVRRYSGGKSLEETRASLCEKVPQEFYTRKLWPDTIKPHVRERIGFDQDMSLVDVMGWHLVSGSGRGEAGWDRWGVCTCAQLAHTHEPHTTDGLSFFLGGDFLLPLLVSFSTSTC